MTNKATSPLILKWIEKTQQTQKLDTELDGTKKNLASRATK